jgi:peptidoglycan/LPS O-acetylase OafA/YrhL
MSVYLDLMRFIAAFLVLVEHLDRDGLSTAWTHANRLGHTAVIVFFVLSGLVIHHSTLTHARGPKEYFLARASRILSVALPAILLSFLLRGLLETFDLGMTRAVPSTEDATWLKFFASIFFLSESWGLKLLPPLNLPFWSLCYEVWYYVLFGLMIYCPRPRLRVWLLVMFAVIGPQILVLFPIWLLGVWLNRSGLQYQMRPTSAFMVWALSAALIIALGQNQLDERLSAWLSQNLNGYWRLWHSNRLVTDYALAALVASNLIAVRSLSGTLQDLFEPLKKPAAYLAGVTFSLYMFHRPLTTIAGLWVDGVSSSIFGSIFAGITILMICVLFSRYTEAKRGLSLRALEFLSAKLWLSARDKKPS